ncbi:hypothetical protein M3P21_22335, partial [Ruegeria sp. 2012CJ41-6]|nr:hypothetical protein [Ruegeria spongiae]
APPCNKVSQVVEDLRVRYVLQGSIRRTDEKIRITTQLIDAVTEGHLWAERYDRDVTDVFAVQSEVARQVAKALSVTLKANESERLYQKYTTNIDAYDVFLQARRTVDVPSRDNILRGEKLFEQVIELDPNFAGGYAGLAFNLSVQVRFQYTDTPSTHLSRALELARKAIELDTDFAWGHIALGVQNKRAGANGFGLPAETSFAEMDRREELAKKLSGISMNSIAKSNHVFS